MSPVSAKVSRTSSRIKCSCKTPHPTPSAAKMYRATSSSGSTSRPSRFCKIIDSKNYFLYPPRSSRVPSCVSAEKAMSSRAETSYYSLNSDRSFQLDEICDTEHIANLLNKEVQQLKDLYHLLHSEFIPITSETKRLICQVKVPWIPAKHEPKKSKQTKNSKREMKASGVMPKKSQNAVSKAGGICSKSQSKNIEQLKDSISMQLRKNKFLNCIKEKVEKIALEKKLQEQGSSFAESESDYFHVKYPTLKDDSKLLKKGSFNDPDTDYYHIKNPTLVVDTKFLEKGSFNYPDLDYYQIKNPTSRDDTKYLKKGSFNDSESDYYHIKNPTLVVDTKFLENGSFNDPESDYYHIRNPTSVVDTKFSKKAVHTSRRHILDSTTEVLKHENVNLKLEKYPSDVSEKLLSETDKHKETLEAAVRFNEVQLEELRVKINNFSEKLLWAEKNRKSSQKIKDEELQAKVRQYESVGSTKITGILENESNDAHDKLLEVIDQLVVDFEHNKNTFEHLTEINKEQEVLIKNQKAELLSKDEQLEIIQTKYINAEIKNESLAKEMEDLKKNILEACKIEAYLDVPKEPAKIKYGINTGEGADLFKEKISIEDQVEEKMPESIEAQSEMDYFQKEIERIEKKLIGIHQNQELDMVDHEEGEKKLLGIHQNQEMDMVDHEEGDSIKQKMKMIEVHKSNISEKMNRCEEILQGFKETTGRDLFNDFEVQMSEQRQKWNAQKRMKTQETKKAMKLATKNLLDSIALCENQVNSQKDKIDSL